MSSQKLEFDDQRQVSRAMNLPQANLSEASIALLSADQEKYYGLEGTAARIWQLTASPISVGAMIATLVAEYQVDEDKCRRDVCQFLGDLQTQGLIHIV